MKISVVVNTWNEEENIERCLSSATALADEIVVVDMESRDRTYELARKFTDKVFPHRRVGYVEPARNFAIDKATGDWVFILDADEAIPQTLALKLKQIAESGEYDFIRVPRKNIVFGKWLENSGWWPDHQIRFFKKGAVAWSEEIHAVPITRGRGFDLPAAENEAIVHYHYTSIGQFIERLNRYTEQESRQLVNNGYKFSWLDLIGRPTNEFLSRFFAWEGYRDGLHGFALSGLQAFSFFVAYLKVWEKENFPREEGMLLKVGEQARMGQKDFNFWFWQKRAQGANPWKKFIFKLAAKFKL